MLEVRFYDKIEDSQLDFAVIIARTGEKWVFCKHKERDTYEVPGGHREAGETIEEAANRELKEETGAVNFKIEPVCVYSVKGKTRVNKDEEKETFEDRMEFISIGGLMPGIELEDVMAGISICRNPDLANVFYRLHLIEAYGTGISKIIGAYADEEEKPVIETTRNTFKIILPNINAMREKVRISEPEAKEENPETNKEDTQELSSEEEQVLEYAGKHEDFTKNDVVSLLKVSASTAARVIRGLVERNFLKRNGKARNTYYTLQK